MSNFSHASRMQAVQSPIIPIVGELIRQSPDTISLGQGVVYYGPPGEAIYPLSTLMLDPMSHRYQAVQGIVPLRQMIQSKLTQENGIDTALEQIVVTAGSNMGFVNAVLAITQPGDEIILLTPYYFNHEMAIRIAGCHPVCVPTDQNYQPQLLAIAAAITAQTRAIVTISPNNPTGAVYPESTLRGINFLCRERGIYHISDEAYEYFTYDGVSHFSPGAISGSNEYTISLFSLSKAYSFASWRIGYMTIPAHLSLAVQKIQDTNLICPPVVSQYAALGALQAGVEYCRAKRVEIVAARQTTLELLRELTHLCTVPAASGAFYLLLRVKTALPAMTLVERLIQEHRVAVIPGDAFGLTQGCYLRVAYGALERDTVRQGVGRLVKGLETILNKSDH